MKTFGITINNIYLEYESGTKVGRIELRRLMAKVIEGDTIIATELSRITRSIEQLCEVIEFAKKNKIKLILRNLVVDCTKQLDAMTEGMLRMIGIFSEIEKNMISERVESGMANAKAKGKIVGRPTTSIDNITVAVVKAYDLLKHSKINKSECARMCDISRPSLDKYIQITKTEYQKS